MNLTSINDYENDVTELTTKILFDSLQKRASDIHFEPYQDEYRIRIRIDGVLQTTNKLSIHLAKQFTVRLKIMAKLNIAEQRLPQDGQLVIEDQTMRMSTLPTLFGEKIVLRIMDNHQQSLNIEELGLPKQHLSDYQQALNAPQGLILVTGPTGSGKTITLYSGLKSINNEIRNICSIEDPIEMPIKGINQTQVNLKAGLNFNQTLRSFLRQDPDVIMVGEIRDQETAEIAVQAAQTGHLVLSTLHTNSSAEALVRLNQMGVKNYLITSSLKLIIAQRLIRKLCKHCRVLAKNPLILENDGKTINYSHFIAKGCEKCFGGYCGRTGLYEFLIINDQIQALLSKATFSLQEIHNVMQKNNMMTLAKSSFDLIQNGITSYAEVQRVLGFHEMNQTRLE